MTLHGLFYFIQLLNRILKPALNYKIFNNFVFVQENIFFFYSLSSHSLSLYWQIYKVHVVIHFHLNFSLNFQLKFDVKKAA